jgi:hypothetical protein
MDEVFVDLHVYFSIFRIITKYRIYFEFWKFHYMMNLNGQNNGGFIQMVMKQKIYPTCLLCDKLNAEMTHCAIYGSLPPENIDNTAIAGACSLSGEYVRLLHASPNEYNYGRLPGGKLVDEEEDRQLYIFDKKDETDKFIEKHGITLEQWANSFFIKRSISKNETEN